MQAICDRLGPGTINVFLQRWFSWLPLPFTDADRDAGYWWETSMRQIEFTQTARSANSKSLRFEGIAGTHTGRLKLDTDVKNSGT